MREVREALRAMNGPVADACMYCETPRANHIDHHEPRVRAPARCFDWSNLVLACATCDTTHKRDRFICPRRDLRPVDPRREDPTVHLRTSSTGCMDVVTPRGDWTREFLGLDDGTLPKQRRQWRIALEALILRYVHRQRAGQADEAALDAELIRTGSRPSVLRDLVADATGDHADLLGLAAVRAAIEAYPEIKSWSAERAPRPPR